jgi:ankyrin repeat protein
MPPLHWACFYQNEECVAALLAAGADPKIQAGPKKKSAENIALERSCRCVQQPGRRPLRVGEANRGTHSAKILRMLKQAREEGEL